MFIEISVRVAETEYGSEKAIRYTTIEVETEDIARALLMSELTTGATVVRMLMGAIAEMKARKAEDEEEVSDGRA